MADTGAIQEMLIEIRSELDTRGFDQAQKLTNSLKNFAAAGGSLSGENLDKLKEDFRTLNAPIQVVKQKALDASKAFKDMNRQLFSASLSMLFFGMALKRISTSIIKSALESFKKITEGSRMSAGAIGILEVHFELLKFTIGEAINTLLQAFLPAIIEIILSITDWIQQHDKLAAGILIVTLALGTLLGIFGTLGSALLGIINLFELISASPVTAALISGFTELAAVVGEFVGVTGLGAILATIALIVLAVMALYAAWKTNLGRIHDTWSALWANVKEIFQTTWELIKNIFKDVMDIIVGIFEGDWEKVGNAVLSLIGHVAEGIVKLFASALALVYDIWAGTMNIIKDLIINILFKLPLSIAQKIAEVMGLDEAAEKLKKIKDSMEGLKTKTDMKMTTGTELLKFIGVKFPADTAKIVSDTAKTTQKTYLPAMEQQKNVLSATITPVNNLNTALTATVKTMENAVARTNEWNLKQAQYVAMQNDQIKNLGFYNDQMAGLRDTSTKNPRNANLKIGGMSADQYYRSTLGDAILGPTLLGVGQAVAGALSAASASGKYDSSVAFGAAGADRAATRNTYVIQPTYVSSNTGTTSQGGRYY